MVIDPYFYFSPIFELKEILSGKYGEDSKLIYDLADQGGELCSLRYDLTVPFARWLAMNPSVQSIKRYHIAKVYRRDQPAIAKGRLREFYQCDFDIAGTYDPMIPDAEILRILCEIFGELGWGKQFTIKINHRGILDGIFEICGVPQEKIRMISSAVDKLDKLPWEEVRKEMTDEKGLEGDVADRIWEFVQKKGAKDVLNELMSDDRLKENKSMTKGIEEMNLLFTYLEAFNVLDQIELNLSLARGLDYYTGLIYEVITEGSAPPSITGKTEKPPPPLRNKKPAKSEDPDEDRSNDPSIGVGSVAAGGRYDELVGVFSSKARIPCVGVSLGVDRIFSITKARMQAEQRIRTNEVDVYVMAFGGKGFTGLLTERLEVCRILWDAGIKVCFHSRSSLVPLNPPFTRKKHPNQLSLPFPILQISLIFNTDLFLQAEFSYKQKPKLPAQFKLAESGGVPFAVVLGDEELAQGKVRIKEMGLQEGHPEKDGVLVDKSVLVSEVQVRLRRKEKEGEKGGEGRGGDGEGKVNMDVNVDNVTEASAGLRLEELPPEERIT